MIIQKFFEYNCSEKIFEIILIMTKLLIYSATFFTLSSCGTLGGLVSGVGEDIKNVGDFIKSD